jgi:hypothetical protein
MSLYGNPRRVVVVRTRIDSLRRCRSRIRFHLVVLAATSAFAASELPAQIGAIGLSGVGGQRFANEDLLLFFEPQIGDHFARVLATGDFDGDGADDLAAGMPHDNGIVGFEIDDCGAVVVRHGVVGSGLATDLADTLLTQVDGTSPDPAELEDDFGGALAACDFNGDGLDDLAVGIPNEDVGGAADAGAVQIFYGSENGLGTFGPFLTQATPGIPGEPELQDFFGFALACGDFRADGMADLAIGVPGESFEALPEFLVGVVQVVYGGPSGLDPTTAISFHQETSGVPGDPENGDGFGWALAAGDFNADDWEDLAVGVPGEDRLGTGVFEGPGLVQVFFGDDAAGGVSPSFNATFGQEDLGGAPVTGDRMGFSLAAGDFDGDDFDDLAIGVPFKDVGVTPATDAGETIVLYGRNLPPMFDLSRTQIWTEDTVHGVGSSEVGDRFGFAVASGDFDRDGRDDLAIGGPGEFALVPADGMVTVVVGSAVGITNARRQGLTAGRDGLPGVVDQANRNYGHAIASGDFDGNGYADLAIGAPNEDENQLADVGALTVVYGALFASGFESGDARFWSSTAP